MIDNIKKGNNKISVIGLGYVGLPIALEFAKKVKVIGFDINEHRIALMKKQIDPSNELESTDFEGADIEFTTDLEVLKEATFHIVAVPTPIDEFNQPDLRPLTGACNTVGKILKKGDYVVFESTVYPGCTEEDCVPILEKLSGLKYISDFKVGYSPERINPGDKVHTLTNITKVVSGCDKESSDTIAELYEMIIKAGIHRASGIKVAEAAKIIENTQRDVNIALMNELSVIFNRMNINTYEVLEAAGTKWNFLKFSPGLVGGHCIGVDPYYLTHKAKKLGYHAQIITSGRQINDSMGAYIAKELVKKMIKQDISLKNSNVLLLGFTFKEDVSDIRNTKVIDVVKELESYMVRVDIVDPHASAEETKHEYGIEISNEIKRDKRYDAIILAVGHQDFKDISEDEFIGLCGADGVLFDIKGIYKNKIHTLQYWSL